MKNILSNSLLGLALWSGTNTYAFDIAENFTTGTQYQGRYKLNTDGESSLGLERFGANGERNLFTTTYQWRASDGTDKKLWTPDLLYRVKASDNIDSLGLRLIPVSYSAQQGDAGSERLDYFMRKLFWGRGDMPGAEFFAIVGHTHANEDLYTDLATMANVKAEVSIGHSSTYYGNNRNSRRGFGHDTNPKNVYIVKMRGVDQVALNTNLMIWSKLYYNNPDGGYPFAEDYHRDQVLAVNLEEVLAFGAGWLDRNWVREDLNAKVREVIREGRINKDFSENTTYNHLLMSEPFFWLYCFEGVNNSVNLGLNIPLTASYLKRIFGERWGAELYRVADDKYRRIQASYGVPANEIQTLAQLEPTLSRMRPLWEVEMGVERAAQITATRPLFLQRNAEGLGTARGVDGSNVLVQEADETRRQDIRKVGDFLSMKPISTADMIKNFSVTYAPFHKVGAVQSTAAIMGYKPKLTARTGIAGEIFDTYSLDILIRMYQYEAGLIASQAEAANQNVNEALRNYETNVRAGLRTALGTDAIVDRTRTLLRGESQRPIPDSPTSIAAAIGRPIRPQGQGRKNADNKKLTAFNAFRKDAEKIVNIANRVPVETQVADLPQHFVDRPADVDSENPTAQAREWINWRGNLISQALRGRNNIKWNFPPGILGSISQEVVKTNPNVMLKAVVTSIDQTWVNDSVNGNAEDPTQGDEAFQALRQELQQF